MKTSFTITRSFSVNAARIYRAWLDSDQHSEMTGGEAVCSDEENGKFSAWDGYISGSNVSLVENEKIVQSWRTTEFKESDMDSELTVQLIDTDTGCDLILTHINIPEGQSDYEQGWDDHYFVPMAAYFQPE